MKNTKRKRKPVDILKLMLEGDEVTKALERGALQARERHRKAGVPMVLVRDGKIVEMTAEELDVEDAAKDKLRGKKRR